MANESTFTVAGYIATEPTPGLTPSGVPTLSMRLAWTPRRFDRGTGLWADQPSSFATVKCFRKLAENGRMSLHKGEPVVISGTLRIREYDAKDGSRRTAVDVTASSIGHDLSRGVAAFRRLRPPAEHSETGAAVGQEGEDLAGAGLTDGGPGEAGLSDGALGDVESADLSTADEMFDDMAEVTGGEPVAAPF